jgi:hypothetical protein
LFSPTTTPKKQGKAMSDAEILTVHAKNAIENHVKQMISTWLKWLGVANGLALLAMFYYVAFEVPGIAAERVVPSVNQRVAGMLGGLEKKYGEAFELSGRLGESEENLRKRTATLIQIVDGIEQQVKTVQGGSIAAVAALVDAAGKSGDTAALIERIKSLEMVVSALGTSRNGPSFSIDNPRMGGPDSAQCPPGTYVSTIQASGAVGGKYAIDGISQITFTCSSIR